MHLALGLLGRLAPLTLLAATVCGGCHREPSRPDASASGARHDASITPAPGASGAALARAGDAAVDVSAPQPPAPPREYGERTARLEPVRASGAGPVRGQRIRHDGSSFPAVSRDGSQVVVLADDALDFAGTAVQTLRFLDVRTGKTNASVVVYDEMREREVGDDKALERLHRARDAKLAQASARLASTTWKTLEPRSTPEEPGRGPWAQLGDERDAGPGWTVIGVLRFREAEVDIELLEPDDPTKDIRLHVRRVRDGKLTSRMSDVTFPEVGFARQGRAACGSVTGFAGGYLDPERRFALLFPSANLGGDNCTGQLGIETATLARLSE